MVRKYLNEHPPLPRFLLNANMTNPVNNETFNNSSSSSAENDHDSFDNNMMIILAVLLCALICALGLNSIVRCALRFSRRFPYENSQGGLGSSNKGGVTKDVLRGIPVISYKSGMNFKAATDCAICLAEFCEGERLRVLPVCDHGFHVMCIDTWLRSHSSCPTCRHLLSHHSANR